MLGRGGAPAVTWIKADAEPHCAAHMPDLRQETGASADEPLPPARAGGRARAASVSRRQFALMLAARMTGAQRAMSASIRARNSAGVEGIGAIT